MAWNNTIEGRVGKELCKLKPLVEQNVDDGSTPRLHGKTDAIVQKTRITVALEDTAASHAMVRFWAAPKIKFLTKSFAELGESGPFLVRTRRFPTGIAITLQIRLRAGILRYYNNGFLE